MNKKFLRLNDEVAAALADGMPIVALESTIISHGMPWPKNVETALMVEETVRKNGAVPATIAIKNGECLAGLSKEDLEFFGREKDIWKVSLRDMPFVVSNKIPGATTVATTMRIAAMAGIKIFATGGIGGVHRGAEKSMDISADLTEMSQTNVAVVSAGIKSILDIGLTLEYLETSGIPLVTFGQDNVPGFYSSASNFKTPLRLDSAKSIASLLLTKWALGLKGSVLIANPVPSEQQVDPAIIEKHIEEALHEAEKLRITGKDITPFLLKHIAEHTGGESLEANIALVMNNAKLASIISVEMVNLQNEF